MRARWLMGLLMLTAGLTGCIGNVTDDVEQQSVDTTPDLPQEIQAQDDQLWHDPQTNAHPAFDHPTLTTVPEDVPETMPEYWEPVEPANFSVEDLSINHLSEDPNDTASYGTGIAIFGELVIVPGRSTGKAWTFSLDDPENPTLVSEFKVSGEDAEDGGRDVDTVAFPDGRLYAAFATDSGIVPVWNLTDPTSPEKVATIKPDRGSHNVGFVPGTPILYNSASLGGGAGSNAGDGQEGTAIYDLSDPSNPEQVQDFENGYSCHDITFSIRESMGEYRAYCAGIEMTQIWDIQDPENPEVVTNVPVHHGNPDLPSTAVPLARFSHLAMASANGDILIVGDETGGGIAPGCDAHATAAGQTTSGPVGNLYFYDISDESSPEYLAQLSPNAPATATDEVSENPARASGSCTAHFGRLIPSEEKNLLAITFYARGVNIVDFTDPSAPEIVEQYNDGTNTWDVWFYQGYLVTGDITRGMDVFELGS